MRFIILVALLLVASVVSVTAQSSGTVGYNRTTLSVAPTNLIFRAASITSKITNASIYGITGILKGDGIGGSVEAVAGVDYEPAGGGGGTSVYVNGTEVSNPNFTNSATATFSVATTNVSVHPTNLANAQIASGAAIDFSKLSGVAALVHTHAGEDITSGTVAAARIDGAIATDAEVSAAVANVIHSNVGGEIAAITDKATPVAADHLLIEDSAASDAKKDITIASLETVLEGFLDLDQLQGQITFSQMPTGSLIWTNGSGIVSNTITATATNFLFNSSASVPFDNLVGWNPLARVQNNTTNTLLVDADSSLTLGRGERPSYNSAGFYRKSDAAKGDKPFNDIFWQAYTDESDLSQANVNFDVALSVDPGFPGVFMSITYNSNSVARAFYTTAQEYDSGGLGMGLSVGTDFLALLSPDAINPFLLTTATPYQFKTSVPVASGDFMALTNLSTKVFGVAAVSGWSGAGTQFWMDDGTAKTLSAAESAIGVNVLLETEIDASSELLALMDDETGSGVLVFGTSPTFSTSATITGTANTTGLRVSGISNTGSDATTGINLSGTWNTSANPTFLRVYVTNTASAATAKVLDVGINTSSSRFSVDANGNATAVNFTSTSYILNNSDYYLRNNAGRYLIGASDDVLIGRDAAATVQLGTDAATATNQKIKAHDGSGTDKVGANLTASPGNGTGTGKSGAFIVTTSPFSTTGSSQNTAVERFIVAPEITLTDAATSAFEIALPTLRTAGGVIRWTIEAGDGTDVQSRSGITVYSVVNKGGVYTKQLSTPGTETESVAQSSGTLTGAWSILDGTNKVTLQFTPAGSLSETTYRLYYTLENNSRQAITLL